MVVMWRWRRKTHQIACWKGVIRWPLCDGNMLFKLEVNYLCCLYLCWSCSWWWWQWRLRTTMMKEEVKEKNSTKQQEQQKGTTGVKLNKQTKRTASRTETTTSITTIALHCTSSSDPCHFWRIYIQSRILPMTRTQKWMRPADTSPVPLDSWL